MAALIALGLIGLAAVLVIAWIVRQNRKVRELERNIDHSRLRRWQDDDD